MPHRSRSTAPWLTRLQALWLALQTWLQRFAPRPRPVLVPIRLQDQRADRQRAPSRPHR